MHSFHFQNKYFPIENANKTVQCQQNENPKIFSLHLKKTDELFRWYENWNRHRCRLKTE